MKPILEWLNEAKEQGYDWADAAIRNYYPDYAIIKETKDLSAALIKAFSWRKSPEGFPYWNRVFEIITTPLPTTAVNSTSIECLVEDLGKLNSAIENLEYNDTLKEPYRTQVYEATKASYEEQLVEVKTEIAKELGLKGRELIGWVVANTIDMVYLIGKPEKVKAGWSLTKSLTPEEAIALCGRVPKWSDDEPTPVYQ